MNKEHATDSAFVTDRPKRRHAVFHLPEACARLLEGVRPELRERLFVIPDPQDYSLAGEIGMAARSCGIRPGQSLWELQRQHRDLLIIHLPENFYSSMRERLSAVFLEHAPEVLEHSLGEWELDLTGCDRLVQGRWEDWCEALHTQLATELGVSGNLALASRRSTARILARTHERTTLCPSGQESSSLASLTLEVVPELSEGLRLSLLRQGLRTLGEIARTPRHLMVRRFGTEGEKLCAMARGMDIAPVVSLTAPAAAIEDSLDLFAAPAAPETETARPARKKGKGRWQESTRLAA